MHNFLVTIVEKKQQELLLQKKNISLVDMKKRALISPVSSRFFDAIRMHAPAIIGEIKFASPTQKHLGVPATLLARVKAYEKAGIRAISIITEKHFFKGDVQFIAHVKKSSMLPILQKDFVVDVYQIYQAAVLGSDALLFIARMVDAHTLKRFVDIAMSLGIEPVVEIVDRIDLAKAKKTATRIIAVNARDLDTFTVDITRAARLIRRIPVKYQKLGFSGISSKDDAASYISAGAQGILIGTTLMKEVNVDAFISSLK